MVKVDLFDMCVKLERHLKKLTLRKYTTSRLCTKMAPPYNILNTNNASKSNLQTQRNRYELSKLKS